jgi:hypothetical protein
LPDTVTLRDSDGRAYGVPQEQVSAYIAQGFRPETDEESVGRTASETFRELHGGVGGAVGAGLSGALSGLTLGLSDQLISDRGIRHAREEHPYATGAGTIAGALAPALLTGGAAAGAEAGLGARILAASPAGLTSRLGSAISGLGEGAGLAGRVGAATLGAGAEGALYGGGQYLTETALEDKPLSAEGFVAGMGHGALFAAPIGGAGMLASRTLQRARSLFPRSEVSAAAAAGVQEQAASSIAQAARDGDAMVAAAERKLSDVDAQTQIAQIGETTTRRVFGEAHPQAMVDQVTGAVDRQQIAQALDGYQQARAQLDDWLAAESDPELARALAGLQAPETGMAGGRIGPQVPVGEFGAPGARGYNPGEVAAPGPPSQAPLAAEPQGTPVTRALREGATPSEPAPVVAPETAAATTSDFAPQITRTGKAPESTAAAPSHVPLNDDEYKAYKQTFGHASDAKLMAAEFRYSKGGDEVVNPALRSGEPLDGEALHLRDTLDAGFAMPESRLPREAQVYRGLHGPDNIARFADVKPGDVLEDPAFLSTAYSASAKSRNENIVLTINAKAGTPAMPIRSNYSNEGELLFPRGTKLRVDKVEYIPITERWQSLPEKYEVLPDKSVRLFHRNTVSIEPPIKDIHVTVISEHAPPSITRAPRVDLSAPVDQLSLRQLGEYQDEIDKALKTAAEGSPERTALYEKWDAAVARRNAITDKVASAPDKSYVMPRAAVANAPASESLTGLLRGTQEKLGAGGSLREMGAPSREAYATDKAARTAEAARHFRAKALEARDLREPWNAGFPRGAGGSYETSPMAAAEREAQGIAAKQQLTGIVEPGAVPRFDPETRSYFEGAPPAGTAPAHTGGLDELAKAFGVERGGMPVSAAEYGARREAMGLPGALERAPRKTPEERAIAKAIMRHNGKNVDIGPNLAQGAKVLGDMEEASARLTDVLGADAPATAVENAKAYRAAIRAQSDASAESSAKAGVDIKTRVQPAADATQVDDDIAKALRQHEMRNPPAVAPASGGGLGRGLADVGSALEVLHAIGAHVPAVSHIPVIGPILGLWLKARAVWGILGRKGGSIGRSTEGAIAAKAAATRERIVAATGVILEGAAKGAGAASHLAGPAVLLAGQLFAGGDKPESAKPRDLFDARVSEIVRAQQPGAIDQAISQRFPTSDPALHDAIVAQIQRGIAFLDSKRPKQTVLPGVLPGDGTWQPSMAAINEFAKYVHAVNDPVSVLEDLAKGHPSAEGAETLRVVYPALYAYAQKELLRAAPQMATTLPYSRRVMISILYKIPVDGTMQPSHAQYLQTAMPPTPAPASPHSTGPLRLGQQTMSPLDQRASGA